MPLPTPIHSSPLFPMPRTLRRMMDRRRHKKSVQQILHLDDHMLHDIGMTRLELMAAIERRMPY